MVRPLILSLFLAAAAGSSWAQCGFLLVVGNDTGYSPNVQSTTQGANEVAQTWAKSQAAPNDYAIFQDHDPWGATIVKTAIANAGHSYTVFPFASLGGFTFSNYRVIVLNFDDTNVNNFLADYAAVIPALEAYVQAGGVVWLQGGIQNGSGTTYSLPFGGTGTFDLQNNDTITQPTDPLMTGLSNPVTGNYASHAHFTGYPAGARVLVTTGTVPGGATVLYTYQAGTCPFTATPTPTSTATFTGTPTQTSTRTFTATPTATLTPTDTPTLTPTLTPCGYPGNTCTPTPTPEVAFYVSQNLFVASQGPVSIYVAIAEYPGTYRLAVFNTAGEQVRVLGSGALTGILQSSFFWDGKNEEQEPCASGVYLIQLTEPLRRQTRKVLLVR